jgi:hypothetical protein
MSAQTKDVQLLKPGLDQGGAVGLPVMYWFLDAGNDETMSAPLSMVSATRARGDVHVCIPGTEVAPPCKIGRERGEADIGCCERLPASAHSRCNCLVG